MKIIEEMASKFYDDKGKLPTHLFINQFQHDTYCKDLYPITRSVNGCEMDGFELPINLAAVHTKFGIIKIIVVKEFPGTQLPFLANVSFVDSGVII